MVVDKPTLGATVTVTDSPVEFERSWQAARRQYNFATLAELALDNYDDGDSAPSWLKNDIRDVCDEIARDLDQNLNRKDDSELGVYLIQLSSFLGSAGCMFALLGLAYQCGQPGEQGGAVNPKAAGLLDSQLVMFDYLPRERWPAFAVRWRELAIRRVEALVRLDFGRQVEAIRESYWEAVNMANLILVYEPAQAYLQSIKSKLPLLDDARRSLGKYLPLLEHPGERQHLVEDLDNLTNMINAGRHALNQPRR